MVIPVGAIDKGEERSGEGRCGARSADRFGPSRRRRMVLLLLAERSNRKLSGDSDGRRARESEGVGELAPPAKGHAHIRPKESQCEVDRV